MSKKLFAFVLSQKEAEKYEFDEPHIFISIRSPGESPARLPVNQNRVGSIFLDFYDIDCKGDKEKEYKYADGLFCENDAINILRFVEKHKDIDTVLVNCEAGISRSAAVAAALTKIINGNDSFYFDHYVPNRFIYRTILETKYNGLCQI